MKHKFFLKQIFIIIIAILMINSYIDKIKAEPGGIGELSFTSYFESSPDKEIRITYTQEIANEFQTLKGLSLGGGFYFFYSDSNKGAKYVASNGEEVYYYRGSKWNKYSNPKDIVLTPGVKKNDIEKTSPAPPAITGSPTSGNVAGWAVEQIPVQTITISCGENSPLCFMKEKEISNVITRQNAIEICKNPGQNVNCPTKKIEPLLSTPISEPTSEIQSIIYCSKDLVPGCVGGVYYDNSRKSFLAYGKDLSDTRYISQSEAKEYCNIINTCEENIKKVLAGETVKAEDFPKPKPLCLNNQIKGCRGVYFDGKRYYKGEEEVDGYSAKASCEKSYLCHPNVIESLKDILSPKEEKVKQNFEKITQNTEGLTGTNGNQKEVVVCINSLQKCFRGLVKGLKEGQFEFNFNEITKEEAQKFCKQTPKDCKTISAEELEKYRQTSVTPSITDAEKLAKENVGNYVVTPDGKVLPITQTPNKALFAAILTGRIMSQEQFIEENIGKYLVSGTGESYEIIAGGSEEIVTVMKSGTARVISKKDALYKKAGWGWDTGLVGNLKIGIAAAASTRTILAQTGIYGGFTEEQETVLGDAISNGIMAYYTTKGTMEQFIGQGFAKKYSWIGVTAGAATMLFHLYHNYEDIKTDSVVFECTTWEPPKGGRNCEKCNDEILGCSEYQCRSLGKGCALLNAGTDEEICTWINKNDAEVPEIRPWNLALINETYKYDSNITISPPDRGIGISLIDGGCIPAYTPLKFGVSVNEPSTCKIDTIRRNNYEEMLFYMGGSSTAKYNHSHQISLPSPEAEDIVIESGTNMSMYVRCEDANGNANIANFVFKFCVEDEEDYTPPLIVSTSIRNNQPIAHNLTFINMSIYTNEPADCKWDFTDKTYERMEGNLTCSKNKIITNSQILYSCNTTITGIKDLQDNFYYFRCNDSQGNKNRESYELNLIGTQPLFINAVRPNETTITDKTTPVEVILEIETSGGYQDGNAFCFYKSATSTGDYIQFAYNPIEMTFEHSQSLFLDAYTYDYMIKCIDEGGNKDEVNITFDVKTDLEEPTIVRAYREGNYLKVITNENGKCVYNTDLKIGCEYNFGDGVTMESVGETEHFVEWEPENTFYIKCQDEFENPPNFNSCSIITKAQEIQEVL